MKEFRLSTPADRIAGIGVTVVAIAAFAALLYALRTNIWMLIFCALSVLLMSALMLIHVRNVLRAAVYVDAEKKILQVHSFKDYTLDVQNATMLQTIAQKNGQSTVRLLVFSDCNDEIIATVPTMFTFRQGIWADPMAKEMAAALGIEFKQNVPDWQLDKEKYKEYVKEEEAREKREAKERRQKIMERRIQKHKNRK